MMNAVARGGSAEGIEVDGVVHRPDGLRHLTPERAGALLGLLRAGEALGGELSRRLEDEHGLTLREFEVLLFLAVFAPEGHLRISQLSDQAPLSQSRVSRLVGELERRGLVQRSPSTADGRGVSVSITERGIERFKGAQETHLEDLDRLFFSRLTAPEIRHLGRITTKILEACEGRPSGG
jgi:DNA-binding MarR family transcriptional regulator